MPGETAIHDLHVRPNIDGKPIYPQIFIESTAALGGIFLDGQDVRELHAEIARLRDEIALLLNAEKEPE